MRSSLTVEIWSDVVCPWCYIGKRRLERAAERLADEVELQIAFRPYQLDPTAPDGSPTPVSQAYARKFGGADQAARILAHVTEVAAADGLAFHMDRALRANTRRAHRLLWLAEATGHQYALKERLLRSYFSEGLDVGDIEVLATLAEEVGMPADRVRGFLASDDGDEQLDALLRQASEMGVTAVPTFVFDGRWVVPGAQDVDTFVTVIRKLLAKRAEP